jgi:hypothetical protein
MLRLQRDAVGPLPAVAVPGPTGEVRIKHLRRRNERALCAPHRGAGRLSAVLPLRRRPYGAGVVGAGVMLTTLDNGSVRSMSARRSLARNRPPPMLAGSSR